MPSKEKVLRLLQNLPETFSVDQVITKPRLLAKVEEGRKPSKADQVIPGEKFDEHLPEWIK